MLGTARHAGKRIEHTTTYLLRCPASTVPEAMRASRFINMESSNSAKQMAVIDAKKNATPPQYYNRLINTCGDIKSVSADHCSHRWRLGITTIETNNTRRYAVDEAKTDAKAHQEELTDDAEASRQYACVVGPRRRLVAAAFSWRQR